MSTLVAIVSPYRSSTSFSVPNDKLDAALAVSVLLNHSADAQIDVSGRPSDNEHARLIDWLLDLTNNLDHTLMRYCHAWISLIMVYHMWRVPDEGGERQRVQDRVSAWISAHLHDSNTLRLDMMLFVTAVMLSDDDVHRTYIRERNFSLASMARLRRSFVMNADHVRRLLEQVRGREHLDQNKLIQLVQTIDTSMQQGEATQLTRTIQRIDDSTVDMYLVLWMGGKRRQWVKKDTLRSGAAQWQAKVREYEGIEGDGTAPPEQEQPFDLGDGNDEKDGDTPLSPSEEKESHQPSPPVEQHPTAGAVDQSHNAVVAGNELQNRVTELQAELDEKAQQVARLQRKIDELEMHAVVEAKKIAQLLSANNMLKKKLRALERLESAHCAVELTHLAGELPCASRKRRKTLSTAQGPPSRESMRKRVRGSANAGAQPTSSLNNAIS
jgi:hypothetical protein